MTYIGSLKPIHNGMIHEAYNSSSDFGDVILNAIVDLNQKIMHPHAILTTSLFNPIMLTFHCEPMYSVLRKPSYNYITFLVIAIPVFCEGRFDLPLSNQH